MKNVIDALIAHAACHPGKPAFVARDEAMNYGELFRHVSAAATWADRLPDVIGLFGGKSLDWVIADLALATAGKTVVPMPDFFSEEQLRHIADNAGVEHILCTTASSRDRAHAFGRPLGLLGRASGTLIRRDTSAKRVIYTSGTTGHPKGVRLSSRQVDFMAIALAEAAAASPNDICLSLLPYAMLLEQIAGAYVPILAGATVHLADEAFAQLIRGNPNPVIESVTRKRPTVSVLVPEMLSVLVAAQRANPNPVKTNLRYVAVGGAPINPTLSEAAWAHGIPVHEGYGLSECCSVVSVNRYGARRAGTVGIPLSGLNVAIQDGEIVVSGPSVMDGYAGSANTDPIWRTGDLGSLDDSGYLRVDGRRDNVLVTALGRNISPEWIESGFQSDPRLRRAVAFVDGAHASILLTPVPTAQAAFTAMTSAQIDSLVKSHCGHVPSYARPHRVIFIDEGELRTRGLLTPNGKPNRMRIAEQFGSHNLS